MRFYTTPSIYEIKRLTAWDSPHFFDRGTLRHFGQTLKSFKVRRRGGRVFIWAPISYDGRPGGYAFREVVDTKLVYRGSFDTEAEIEDYLDAVEDD